MGTIRRMIGLAAGAALGWLCAAAPAMAKPARCFTTDDGAYPCEFTATDADGSFSIAGRGKPTVMLNMVSPGVAAGFVTLGGRNVALPGQYRRDRSDPACWTNDSTGARVCAR